MINHFSVSFGVLVHQLHKDVLSYASQILYTVAAII